MPLVSGLREEGQGELDVFEECLHGSWFLGMPSSMKVTELSESLVSGISFEDVRDLSTDGLAVRSFV